MVKKNLLVDITIYISFIFLGLYLSVFQRSLEDIGNYYNMASALQGILITSHFTGLLIMPLVAGEISDKYGRKMVSCLGYFFFFAGLITMLITTNIYVYVFAVFLIGGGFGIIEVLMTTLLVDLNPKKGSMVINVSQAFFVIGTASGPLLVSLFLSKGYDWRHLYAIFAGISLIYLLYFSMLSFKKDAYSEAKLKGILVLRLLKEPLMVLFALSILLYVGMEQGVSFYINTYIKSMTSSELVASLALSGFWGFMIVGRVASSYISRKINPKKMIIVLAGFAGLSLMLIVFSRNYFLAAIGFSVLGLGLSGIWPLLVYSASASFPRFAGTTIGIMMAFSAAGGMIIPFISNAIGSFWGANARIASFLVPTVIIILFQAIILKKGIKPREQS
ncbi:MAG: MFS transporter [Actinomycetia bacterium]|nr:MFS transporter [Actinomycetes bacterium]